METMQRNSNWADRPQTKKGEYGEKKVHEYLEAKGFVVYLPVTPAAHAFDRLAIKDKKQAVIVECKAKARRTRYADTGINITHYNDYLYISKKHNLPVFIFFIDEHLREIYGNFLSELERPTKVSGKMYPAREGKIIYFPLVNMRRNIARLSESDSNYLKQQSRRNYEY